MKLDEVATSGELQKCGIILASYDSTIDAGDWQGSTEVYTNKTAFINRIKEMYLDNNEISDEEKAQVKKMKTLDQLSEIEGWNDFIEQMWIDDRF